MTNEMKLITALCGALGFDVETVCVNQDDIDYMLRGGASFRPDPIYEYKLTKSVGKAKTIDKLFTKPQEKDKIFNTEMFGEVSVRGPSSDLASSEYNQTSLSIDNDYQKGLVCRIYDSVSIGDVIKALDKLYIARGKA
jgi:hypothetical protein